MNYHKLIPPSIIIIGFGLVIFGFFGREGYSIGCVMLTFSKEVAICLPWFFFFGIVVTILGVLTKWRFESSHSKKKWFENILLIIGLAFFVVDRLNFYQFRGGSPSFEYFFFRVLSSVVFGVFIVLIPIKIYLVWKES